MCEHDDSKQIDICAICKKNIKKGTRYIENGCGEVAHLECIDYMKDLLEFLGYRIKKK